MKKIKVMTVIGTRPLNMEISIFAVIFKITT